ncbi:HAD family hydrolase [Hymenobacter wooponensis]|uniref:HAD family hydrolase n=1 Tax=Hymenobacter wooponensis TaxID=1525360 RepID=A0A4Z0MLB1_9BACT|nr:HAD family hydrolase [Hymenobacter wooponensis]
MLAPEPVTRTTCAHCGDECADDALISHGQSFCCAGCRTVYELLAENNLCSYYNVSEPQPGQKIPAVELPGRFDYLDSETVQTQLLAFRSDTRARLTLQIPQMHCASCIWLLERLYQLNPGVQASQVNFLRKEIAISYNPSQTTLKEVVKLLAALGYEPQITLAELGPAQAAPDRTIYYRLGLAAFCFGNVMLLAFPDYFSFTEELATNFGQFFGYLSLLLALPVLAYSARGFYESAWQGLRHRYINLDFPISLGLSALFLTSVHDIVSHSGPGYLDSFTGLVFFMLIGKWAQQHTYDALRFDRDFTSYFPVAVTVLTPEGERTTSVKELRVGQRIRVRHQEVVPADAVLMQGAGQIDYSFVSGESEPVAKVAGELVYAGGRQVGESVELEVVREVSQGYLTQLWNNPVFQKAEKQTLETYANTVGRYFVALTLVLAAGAMLYWYPRDQQMALRAFTSVLVIACPCALSLATPFALGAALRVFGRRNFYLKNSAVAETLARANTIVFDKTGTLTEVSRSQVEYYGTPLTTQQQALVAAVAGHSTHPLSQRLAQTLGHPARLLTEFREVPGQGVCGVMNNVRVKLGSAAFVGANPASTASAEVCPGASRVYVALNEQPMGCYVLLNAYRPELPKVLQELTPSYNLVVLSGDNDAEQGRLRQLFGPKAELRFFQSPQSKLEYVAELQRQGRRVVMLGDGLNDAGALRQADVGIALTDKITHFSPACDAILDARSFGQLGTFLQFSRSCMHIVLATFGLSFLYNGIGLTLAVQGRFTPIVSAILMPISSLSVILFATLLVKLAARRWKL